MADEINPIRTFEIFFDANYWNVIGDSSSSVSFKDGALLIHHPGKGEIIVESKTTFRFSPHDLEQDFGLHIEPEMHLKAGDDVFFALKVESSEQVAAIDPICNIEIRKGCWYSYQIVDDNEMSSCYQIVNKGERKRTNVVSLGASDKFRPYYDRDVRIRFIFKSASKLGSLKIKRIAVYSFPKLKAIENFIFKDVRDKLQILQTGSGGGGGPREEG